MANTRSLTIRPWPIAGVCWIEFHAEPRTADLPDAPEQLLEPALFNLAPTMGLLASVSSTAWYRRPTKTASPPASDTGLARAHDRRILATHRWSRHISHTTLRNTFVVQRKCCAGLHRRQGQHAPMRRPSGVGINPPAAGSKERHKLVRQRKRGARTRFIRRARKDLRLPPTALHRVQQGWRDSRAASAIGA